MISNRQVAECRLDSDTELGCVLLWDRLLVCVHIAYTAAPILLYLVWKSSNDAKIIVDD